MKNFLKRDRGTSGSTKEIKESTTDPESGWFHKGEYKQGFAYSIETACDKNGWILGYTVSPGNEHDSRTFKGLFDKIEDIGIRTLMADAGYKTPAIVKLLIDKGIFPQLMHRKQRPCKSRYQAYLGRIYGKMRRYKTYHWHEGIV